MSTNHNPNIDREHTHKTLDTMLDAGKTHNLGGDAVPVGIVVLYSHGAFLKAVQRDHANREHVAHALLDAYTDEIAKAVGL